MKAYPLSLDGMPPPIARRSRWRRFVDRHLPTVVIYLMVATLVAVVLYPHVVVTVPSGHVGVLWKRFGGGTVLDPRQLQGRGPPLHFALGRAVPVRSEAAIRYRDVQRHLQRRREPDCDDHHPVPTEARSDPRASPGDRAELRDIAGTARNWQPDPRGHVPVHRRAGLFDGTPGDSGQDPRPYRGEAERQDDGARRRGIVQRRNEGHDVLYDTLVHGIELPALVVAAINRKTEQYYISEEYKFRVEREKERSERKKIEAEGIRDFQQIVSQGISDSYLRWRGIEATLQLSQSTNSKVVIIGSGKDGLPIILGNVDSPAPASAGGAAPTENDATPKERATAAAPTVPMEKTPAAGLPKPAEKTPAAGLTTPSEKVPAAGSGASPAATPAEAAVLVAAQLARHRSLAVPDHPPDRAEARAAGEAAVRRAGRGAAAIAGCRGSVAQATAARVRRAYADCALYQVPRPQSPQ